jgi:hypothetical protein
MAINRVATDSKFESFVFSSTLALNVGSLAGRAVCVVLGRTSTTPVPTGCTYNGVALTAGTQYTDTSGYRLRPYYGIVAASGTNNVVGSWDSDLGQAFIIASSFDGVAAITQVVNAALVSTTPSWTVTSAVGDVVTAIGWEENGRTLTPSAPATKPYEVIAGYTRFQMQEAGASSVVIDGTWSGTAGWRGSAFNLQASGGGGSAIAVKASHYHRLMGA